MQQLQMKINNMTRQEKKDLEKFCNDNNVCAKHAHDFVMKDLYKTIDAVQDYLYAMHDQPEMDFRFA